jgi:hypothetical protein
MTATAILTRTAMWMEPIWPGLLPNSGGMIALECIIIMSNGFWGESEKKQQVNLSTFMLRLS